MKKKWVSLVSAVALGAIILSSCGFATIAPRTADGRVEVEFWFAGGKTSVRVWQEMIDEYNKSQTQYHIKAVSQSNYEDTYDTLKTAIDANKVPDLVLLDPTSARSLEKKDLLADIDELGKSNKLFNKDNYISVFANQGVSYNGKRFGVPAYGTTQVMYYNKDAFEAANLKADDIQTWQDLGKAAKAIKDTGHFKYGWEPMWGASNLIDASLSNNGKVLSKDGKKVTINSKEWVEVWEQFRVWIFEDQTMAVNSGNQGWEYWYKTIDDVLMDRAGGYTGSSGDRADLDFKKVHAMEQPAWDKNGQSAPAADARLLNVLANATAEEKAGAFDFITYFTNVDNQAKWSKALGYIPVNKNISDSADYQAYITENPEAIVPFRQALHGSILPEDPTNGAIYQALQTAADKVELQNVPAQEALDEAQASAQEALDQALQTKGNNN